MADMIPASKPRSWMPDSAAYALADDPIRAKLLELYQHNLDRTRNEWRLGIVLSKSALLRGQSTK